MLKRLTYLASPQPPKAAPVSIEELMDDALAHFVHNPSVKEQVEMLVAEYQRLRRAGLMSYPIERRIRKKLDDLIALSR
jgi:hypothetical protein